MNIFDVLAVVNGLLALIALYRIRPATLFFAGNQFITLRALSDFRQYGRPPGEEYLPASIFSLDRLEIAANIFLITTPLLAIATMLPTPQRPPTPTEKLPALPRWLLYLLAAYVIAFFFSMKSIFVQAYATPEQYNYFFGFYGVNPLLFSLILYEVYRRVRVGQLKSHSALIVLFAIFTLTGYLKGSTGQTTGYLLCSAVLLFGARAGASSRNRWIAMALSIALIVSLSAVTRAVRGSLSTEGTGAITSFLSSATSSGERFTPHAHGSVEYESNSIQYAEHTLECIALYEAGHSREWRSVYNPLIYTFEPSFLLEPLGIQRPREPGWELGDWFIHGGGLYVSAEMYWNGGYLCVALVTAFILFITHMCDTRFASSFVWLTFMCQYVPESLAGYGYGFAHVVRGLFNALIVLGVYQLFRSRQTVTGVVPMPSTEAEG
jgi:hypothetical protein